MKHLAWILLFALVPMDAPKAQVRVSGGVSIRTGSQGTRVVPRVLVEIGKRVRDQRSSRGSHGRRVHDARSHRSPRRRAPAPRGHYRIVCERVWVPPVYEFQRLRCGRVVRVCVRKGYWKTVHRRVFVPHGRGHGHR